MSDFIGQIKMYAGRVIPREWLACEGQVLPVNDYAALFSLIGNDFGGKSSEGTFALPDLRGRVPIGAGAGPGLSERVQGSLSGVEDVALNQTQIPSHSHVISSTSTTQNNLTVVGAVTIKCSNKAGDTGNPSNAFPAKTKDLNGDDIYTSDVSDATSTMNSAVLDIEAGVYGDVGVSTDSICGMTGGQRTHTNMQPWLCVRFIIKYDGIYPQDI